MTRYRLTPREVEVLALYLEPDVRGPWRRVNEAIAKQLGLSEVTVRDYISAILKKLDTPGRDRLKLRAWAIQEGIIPS
jgi:DNA-binding NarL/FixJ family response regulator